MVTTQPVNVHSEHLLHPRSEPLSRPAAWCTRLSTEQLRFYFLHEMNPNDPDIYICRILRISGVVDAERLRNSVLDLVRRHDILRSYYPRVDGQPQIWLRDHIASALAMIDLSRLPAQERVARTEELISSELEIREAFRIEEGPLFRITAIDLGGCEHVMIFRFHHLILDGTSVRLFLSDLLETYRGEISVRSSYQFRDFVEWESKRVRNENRNYWEKKLARPPVLDLTIDQQRPARHMLAAGTVHTFASSRLLAAVRAACRELHVTPYMVWMSVFQILLHKVTSRRDVLVGTPIACRQRVEFLPMFGVLLNWVAFRGELRPEMTFKDILAQIRGEFPEAYARQCSYESLLSAAGQLARDPARNPLFQVTLNYAVFKELPAPVGWSATLDPIVNQKAHYDLSIRLEEVGDSLGIGLTYYRGAMSAGVAERLCAAMLELAENCLAQPDRGLSAIELDLLATHRVVIASTFTAEQIQPTLSYWLEHVGLRSAIEVAPFGQVFQELLAPDGVVGKNKLGTNVLLVRTEDWKNTPSAVREFCELLAAHAERSSAPTIVVVCPPSEMNRGGGRAAEQEMFERAIASVASGEMSSRVHFLSWRTILSIYPVEVVDDAEADTYATAPYSEEFNIALGTALARKIYALVKPGPKVLVLDCDNTLWRGVVGEDGASGLVIDHGRQALQERAIELHRAGVLLCLASKNNEADVWQAFDVVPGMLLKREMFVAHRINWEPKSRNIQSLAAELNLGVDSFVFIDDSPAECTEVRAACPRVLVLDLPAESGAISRFLRHIWPLDVRKITDADRKRAEMYATNARREQLRSSTTDLEQFIASLEVKIVFVPFSGATVERAAQLTQRTNQFNTTTVRRSEAELVALVAGGGEIFLVEVSDRFGDYGIVGLVVYRCGTEVLEVEAFLVSCRALGRGVEQKILAELGRIAGARGLERIAISFRATAKNRPALRFLEATCTRRPREDGYEISAREALAAAGTLLGGVEVEHEEMKSPAVSVEAEPEVSHERWLNIASLDSVAKIQGAINVALARPRNTICPYVVPRDEIEEAICRAWSEVLLVEPIGANDDYFAIGGDSIRSLAVIAKMRKAGLPLAVLDMHQHPTPAQLAEIVRNRNHTPPALTTTPEPALATSSVLTPRALVSTLATSTVRAPESSTSVGRYPLSFSQGYIIRAYARENLRLNHRPSGAFHIQDRLVVSGKSGGHSLSALRRAVELLFSRTPVLRSKIIRDRDVWMQEALAINPAFETVDISSLDAGEQEQKINALLFDDRMRPFDPEHSCAPMMRIYAIIRSESDFELLVTAHHAFADGWSLQTFYTRLFSLYEAYKRRDNARIAELDCPLAANQNAFRELVELERRKLALQTFWREYLPGQFLNANPPSSGYQQRLTIKANWKLVARANERAKASRTSLKAVFLESFSTVLANKFKNRAPLLLAVVTNGRKDDLTAPTEVFGLCWTFVPIVAPPGGERSSRLAALHGDLIATEAHARYPIEEMFHGFDPQASFNLTRFHNAGWRRGTDELEITQAESFHRFHFPLNFNISLLENTQTVILKVTWSSDHFDETFARTLLAEFSAELE